MAEKKDRSKLYQKEYDILLLMLGSGDFTTKARFVQKVGKYDERRTKSFGPRLREYHPEIESQMDSMIQAHKDMEAVNKGIPGMEQVLTEQVTPESMAKIYKAEVLKQMEGASAQKIKALMASMENDLITTRAVTLQACMLAITGYFASIQKRVKNGEVIHTKEFKYAYDIYKTEMGEPVRIKETRMKNLQVTLNVPVSKEEVQQILANQPNHDLQIEIADEFKPQLEDKFNITQTIDDMNTRVRGKDQEDRAVTETAEVPGERAV